MSHLRDRIKGALRPALYSPALYWAYSKYRSRLQSRIIEREQAEYEEKARYLGLAEDWSLEETRERLHKRLAQRGIVPKAKSNDNLHIVYASGQSPWDVINIVPALKKFSRVSTYLLGEHGFDARSLVWAQLRDKMNQHFLEHVKRLHQERPIDVLLTYYSGHHVNRETIQQIGSLGIVTATFHLDDRLLFRGEWLGGRWRGPAAVAQAYDLNLTQAPESLVKYRVEGAIPMLWPLAANPDLCYPRKVPFRYDVSFVGTAYGNRISVIHYLRRHGVNIATFGQGWETGFFSADKFQEIYCASRISLNFDDIGFTAHQCGKIRDFEIPMCGAVMLSTHNEHLNNYFELDSEIFTFRTPGECLLQIRRLLSDDELCSLARKRARERALKEHTWEKRAEILLEIIGVRGPTHQQCTP